MISHWSIRRKLRLGVLLLFIAVLTLSISGYQGVAAFRALAKSVRLRAPELPLSSQLAQNVSKLLVTYNLYKESFRQPKPLLFDNGPMSMEAVFGIDEIINAEFQLHLEMVDSSFRQYSDLLRVNRETDEYRKLRVNDKEQLAVAEFRTLLASIRDTSKDGLKDTLKNDDTAEHDLLQANLLDKNMLDPPGNSPSSTDDGSDQGTEIPDSMAQRWIEPNFDTPIVDSQTSLSEPATAPSLFQKRLERLGILSQKLPEHLHSSMGGFADDVRGNYRTLIVITLCSAFTALLILLTIMRWFYQWVFRPLEILVAGSRRVAEGNFDHRIQLKFDDEIAELATAMNNMTQSFCDIRDDLNQKVREKTKEIVRSEQLASVGFLAAGVAHEINNPLASIAMCAESLDQRLSELTQDIANEGDAQVVGEYLRMIQTEAFRCKEITERLLDFSRLSDVEKQPTDLTDLVQQVIATIKHLGKYKAKEVEFVDTETVYAPVNPQEIKQVVLNLLTNALDSLDAGGKVQVRLSTINGSAKLVVTDNGCGMSDEVQKNLFEPFFTRRRDGQGTGLGMSITYRIITDHGGDIVPHSAGPGTGSTFTVSLPLNNHDEKQSQIRQAA